MRLSITVPSRRYRQRGMTLLELLLAMALGVFLLTGLIQIYLSSQQSYRATAALARIQENGRFAVDELSFDLRMTGFQGCADTGGGANDNRLVGYTATSGSWAPTSSDLAAIESEVITGSDVLVSNTAVDGLDIINTVTSGAATTVVTASNTVGLGNGDAVSVAGCNGAVDATINGAPTVDGGSGEVSFALNADLGEAYLGPNLQLMRADSVIYYVSDQGLMRRTGGASEVVIEDVDTLQVRYGRCDGCDESGVSPRVSYLPASQIDFVNDSVIGVRVGLLISSPDTVSGETDSRQYRVLDTVIGPNGSGTTITYPNDRRLRQAFNTTINLRNLD